jgi:hypothetical protein
MREGLWIVGCIAVAAAITWRMEAEYAGSMYVAAAVLYAVTGAIRLVVRWCTER